MLVSKVSTGSPPANSTTIYQFEEEAWDPLLISRPRNAEFSLHVLPYIIVDIVSFCCRRSWISAFGIATALALGAKLIMILHRGGPLIHDIE